MSRYPDDGLDDEDADAELDDGADHSSELCGHGYEEPCPVCEDENYEDDIDIDGIDEDDRLCADPVNCCNPHFLHTQGECHFPDLDADPWQGGGMVGVVRRVDRSRWRRTRTALNHLARRARRRLRRQRVVVWTSHPPDAELPW